MFANVNKSAILAGMRSAGAFWPRLVRLPFAKAIWTRTRFRFRWSFLNTIPGQMQQMGIKGIIQGPSAPRVIPMGKMRLALMDLKVRGCRVIGEFSLRSIYFIV